MRNVFVIGSRGLPARYGGFETFVENLIKNQSDKDIKYYVASQWDNSDFSDEKYFDFEGATVFQIELPQIGSAKAILYDLYAFRESFKIIKDKKIEAPVFLLLGNTIGGLISIVKAKIDKVGGRLIVNPDGLEWRRAKWAYPVRKYFLFAEGRMVKYSDHIVADNEGIQQYLSTKYQNKLGSNSVIAYGTDVATSDLNEKSETVQAFYSKNSIADKEYYLVVGRFVPENNYSTIIESFLKSNTKKDLVIVTNYKEGHLYDELVEKTHFNLDPRIKFVGTVYDKNLLVYLRENAYGYIHGHSVGGTNPSLLEALSHSKYNLLFDVSFNRFVAETSAYYWQDSDALTKVLNNPASDNEVELKGAEAKAIIQQNYTWRKIVDQYEQLFKEEV
ncbi:MULTISPECIES: beta 1-4 rhamnosyltransferase Cps2T [Weissella]|uniref:beta 1-4 rhamnosyltransferase Cps2T n=1 Tax=Weissella TaxID=46255 RepID=UPI00223BCEB8|nr:DUF1972 domain-containing protein [Weissella cibaria]MCS8561643.1 DUF1972 domain-containing protein [Weissella cibaria]MCS8564882.1 DUF1972 domain-containing protein [Weissella cibaria]MCS8575381.1 DUF1972 domain-containing protein [Weissella cibaria]